MVLSACNPTEIADFCKQHSTQAIGAIWERFSETIMLELHSPAGVISSSTLVADVPQEGNRAANAELLAKPSVDTLVAVMQGMGVTVQQLFGNITGTKYTLEELG